MAVPGTTFHYSTFGFNLAGVAVAGRANTVLCAVKLVPLLAFIGIGVWSIEPARFVPFAPQGFRDLGGTTMLMLFAYVGFEGMVIPAGEMRDPRRVVPRALLLGVATVAAVYLGGPRWDDPSRSLADVPDARLREEMEHCITFIEKEDPDLAEIEDWMRRREPALRASQ